MPYLDRAVKTDNGDFEADPLPHSVEEYLHWIDSQMTFLQKRNRRIAEAFG